MGKLDPIAVALDTLRFLGRRWRTLIRLTWVPMALALAAGLAMARLEGRWYHGQPLDAETTAYLIGNAWLSELVLLFLQAPLVAMTAVAVHRLVQFNDDRPGEWFALSLGRTDGLYVVMGVVFGTLMFAIGVIVAVAMHALFVGMPTWSTLIQGLATDGTVPPGVVQTAYWLSYALVALLLSRMLVWPAAVVARKDVSWREALSLAKGRFFPLAALVLFAILLIVGVAVLAGWIVVAIMQADVIPYETYSIIMTLATAIAFWVATVFFAALVSFTYKALRGYRPDEVMPG